MYNYFSTIYLGCPWLEVGASGRGVQAVAVGNQIAASLVHGPECQGTGVKLRLKKYILFLF
jgi:hypothetical protein